MTAHLASKFSATVAWHRNGAAFLDDQYCRAHQWSFDGGIDVPASSSPHVVPVPMSDEHAVDPEEAFVASLSSCHMLWFLSIARKRGYIIESYRDEAVGEMGRDADGKLAVIVVTLHPTTEFAGLKQPGDGQLRSMHEAAHDSCFIANSVKTDVRCEPLIFPKA